MQEQVCLPHLRDVAWLRRQRRSPSAFHWRTNSFRSTGTRNQLLCRNRMVHLRGKKPWVSASKPVRGAMPTKKHALMRYCWRRCEVEVRVLPFITQYFGCFYAPQRQGLIHPITLEFKLGHVPALYRQRATSFSHQQHHCPRRSPQSCSSLAQELDPISYDCGPPQSPKANTNSSPPRPNIQHPPLQRVPASCQYPQPSPPP
jgi:hypothetical protein